VAGRPPASSWQIRGQKTTTRCRDDGQVLFAAAMFTLPAVEPALW
jgi:hypothetical protein